MKTRIPFLLTVVCVLTAYVFIFSPYSVFVVKSPSLYTRNATILNNLKLCILNYCAQSKNDELTQIKQELLNEYIFAEVTKRAPGRLKFYEPTFEEQAAGCFLGATENKLSFLLTVNGNIKLLHIESAWEAGGKKQKCEINFEI